MLSHLVVSDSLQLYALPAARQVPLSIGFSRQEYWSRLPCPLPRDLPDPGVKLTSPTSSALASEFFTTDATWKALYIKYSETKGNKKQLYGYGYISLDACGDLSYK